MSMELRLVQEIKLTKEQRIEQRQELAIQLKLAIQETREKIMGNPGELSDEAILHATNQIENSEIKNAIINLFGDDELKDLMISESYNLASLTKKGVELFIANYLFNKHKGAFLFKSEKAEDNNGETKINIPATLNVSKGAFITALTEKEKQSKKVQELTGLMKVLVEKGESIEGTSRELEETKNSIRVADAIQETKSVLEKGFLFSMLIQDADKNPILKNFMRELFLLDKFDMAISERMEKRFATNFMLTRNSSKKNLENAFINSIGEYVLISMGIVSPEVFTLQKFTANSSDYEDLKKSLSEAGINLDEISRQYQLSKEGPVFWNRWKTIGIKPTKLTDEKIREFITQTVRLDRETILAGLNYDAIYEKAEEISLGAKTKEEREDANTKLRELLVDTLSQEDHVKLLVNLMKTRWYEKMNIFYSQQKTL